MDPGRERSARASRAMWIAVALAFLAALAYGLIGQGLLAAGDLNRTEAPPTVAYVAAGGYAVGGLLILLRRHGHVPPTACGPFLHRRGCHQSCPARP